VVLVLVLGNCCWHILQLLWNVDAVVFAVAASQQWPKTTQNRCINCHGYKASY